MPKKIVLLQNTIDLKLHLLAFYDFLVQTN